MYNGRNNYLLYMLCGVLSLPATAAVEPGIRIFPSGMEVRDDSVRIGLTIEVSGLRIATESSLSLIPSLHDGGRQVALPPVVFSGRQRARFDRREAAVNPDKRRVEPYLQLTGIRPDEHHTIRYQASLPYASWMEHASLRLQQTGRDCCDETLLADDVLTDDIDLESPCLAISAAQREKAEPQTAAVAALPAAEAKQETVRPSTLRPAVQADAEQRAALTLYIDYPRGGSEVDLQYGHNRTELQKVDSLLGRLLSAPAVTIREVRITGYASPDGAYFDNEALAKARSLGFRAYLTKSYGLHDYPLRTAWVAEDWEGLRRLLKGKPYEKEAIEVIDRYGIFEGRKQVLGQLSGGAPYREMLRDLFPRLRRMEIIVVYKTVVKE